MPAKKKVVAKASVRRAVKGKKPSQRAAQRAPAKRRIKLAPRRPKVTAEEKLYLLFKEDYEARQVFAYLRVETVGELEQYAAAQIIDILTRPLQDTVRRIREKLADKFRFLAGDEEFLARYVREHEGK